MTIFYSVLTISIIGLSLKSCVVSSADDVSKNQITPLAGEPSSEPEPSVSIAESVTTKRPFYRLSQPGSGDHYYTIDKDSRDLAIARDGYIAEGIVGYVSAEPTLGTIPLYRVLLGNGHHYYTTNQSEAEKSGRAPGHAFEGIECYLNVDSLPGTKPFYYLRGRVHFYTSNEDEKNRLVASGEMHLVKTIGHVWK